jgi:hypothetical protein
MQYGFIIDLALAEPGRLTSNCGAVYNKNWGTSGLIGRMGRRGNLDDVGLFTWLTQGALCTYHNLT